MSKLTTGDWRSYQASLNAAYERLRRAEYDLAADTKVGYSPDHGQAYDLLVLLTNVEKHTAALREILEAAL